MRLLDRFRGDTSTPLPLTESTVDRDELEYLQERIADLEFALEDEGWRQLTTHSQFEFSRDGLKRIIALSRLMYIKNPLIQRAVNVKGYYVFGQGVEIQARQDEQINGLLQAWMDDDAHQAELFGQQARLAKETTLETSGNVFFVLFPNTLTGDVKVRSIDVDEIGDIVTSPDDRREIWFYRRTWTSTGIDLDTGAEISTTEDAWYPDMTYTPAFRRAFIGGIPVRWESPIFHVKVGGLETMRFGLPETYAALDWARAYKEFLEDWATIVKSLSRFAWRMTSKKGKAQTSAARLGSRLSATSGATPGVEPNPSPVAGAAFVGGEGTALEPIPKTDATIDVDGAKPLRLMVAAAMDLPDTILSGDPDQGTLATAKTLDRPTELAMLTRQQLWAYVYGRLADYQIDWWIAAPRGPLAGTATRQPGTGRLAVELADESDRTLDVTFPPILEQDPGDAVGAITAAGATGLIPDEEILKLLLTALGVDDQDEIVAKLMETKAEHLGGGTLGNVLVKAFRDGVDPVELLRNGGGGAPAPAPAPAG